MLRHDQIWAAIDALAARHGLSASGLAKRAGLDPTTFNRSKRSTADGRQRWPSTESVAKVLMATNESLDSFVSIIATHGGTGFRLPAISSTEAGRPDAFTSNGEPSGNAWAEIALGGIASAKSFALEVDSGGVTPLYREGTLLVASPDTQVRRGDRVILKLRNGAIRIGEVRRETTTTLDLVNCEAGTEQVSFPRGQTVWIARIHWASQ
jgi:phage repressor protein C with HTH and peptisase S24 domain